MRMWEFLDRNIEPVLVFVLVMTVVVSIAAYQFVSLVQKST